MGVPPIPLDWEVKRTFVPWNNSRPSKQGYKNDKGKWDGPVIEIYYNSVIFRYYKNGKWIKNSPFLVVVNWNIRSGTERNGSFNYTCESRTNYKQLKKCLPLIR